MPYPEYRLVETKIKPTLAHEVGAAFAVATLCSLGIFALRMSVGETDIAESFEPTLQSAKAIDSHAGITEATKNIDKHEALANLYSVIATGSFTAAVITPLALLHTRKTREWKQVR